MTVEPQGMCPTLLIYAPVPLYRYAGEFFVESQAINGLRLWAQHFHHVTVMMPTLDQPPPPGWLPASQNQDQLRGVAIEPLPMAYRPDQFLRTYRSTRARIRQLIIRADVLSFAIGGLFGDWGAVSAFEAKKQKRAFAVWTDRVESEVVRTQTEGGRWIDRMRAWMTHRPMALLEKHVLGMADLGLLHGQETYEAYRSFCSNPQLVHDIHIRAEDHISGPQLSKKIDKVAEGPLNIIYAGRADAMKGPIDWIAVLERLQVLGVDFRATWLGDGVELTQMRRRVARSHLEDRVFLPGLLSQHDQVLEQLRAAQVFMFCHKTPESPRCLIESLCAGTPIVGYHGAFAQDLISRNAGGILVPRGDTEALAQEIADLAQNRQRLSQLIGQARRDGLPFTDEKVFAHRSRIIKRFLAPGSATSAQVIDVPRLPAAKKPKRCTLERRPLI
ncbi:glycosyltransferase [Epibacterium ulvae]|uniref:glycosyltransferase n=1 Tax=Epibacterium ulvae TaxID=1156985 RepID=UPI002493238D|nr:glycosyltransferase [Epibacterium ulvae]